MVAVLVLLWLMCFILGGCNDGYNAAARASPNRDSDAIPTTGENVTNIIVLNVAPNSSSENEYTMTNMNRIPIDDVVVNAENVFVVATEPCEEVKTVDSGSEPSSYENV